MLIRTENLSKGRTFYLSFSFYISDFVEYFRFIKLSSVNSINVDYHIRGKGNVLELNCHGDNVKLEIILKLDLTTFFTLKSS